HDRMPLASDRSGSGRRREPRPRALRAGEALRDPAARLHAGGGRGDADAEAPPPGDRAAVREGDRSLVFVTLRYANASNGARLGSLEGEPAGSPRPLPQRSQARSNGGTCRPPPTPWQLA